LYGKEDSLEDPASMRKQFQRFAVPGIAPQKLPEFYLPHNDRLSPRRDLPNAIKLLSHLLVVKEPGDSWKYYSLTEAGARFYVADIPKELNRIEYEELPTAFVAAFGKSVLVTSLAITPQDCFTLLNEAPFRNIVSLLNVLSGRAFDAHAFLATIRDLGWTRKEYRAFCEYIHETLPLSDEYAPEKFENELFKGL
jgi:hypothetical protein